MNKTKTGLAWLILLVATIVSLPMHAQHPVLLIKNNGTAAPLPASGSVMVLGPLGGAKSPLVSALAHVLPKLQQAQVATPKSNPCRDLYRDRGARNPGMDVEYYHNANLGGQPMYRETVDAIDFDWGDKSPNAQVLGNAYFSMRYTGFLRVPESGDYKLVLTSAGGSKMWLDGSFLIDNWGMHPRTSVSEVVNLQAGRDYPVRIEYGNARGNAMLQLGYTEPQGTNVAASAAKATAVLVTAQATGWQLPADQLSLIQSMAAANPRTVVVIEAAKPVDVSSFQDKVQSIVFVQKLDAAATASVLAGKADATARLVQGWNSQATAKNLLLDGSQQTVRTFKVQDEGQLNSPLAFGHGRSLCEFFYSNLKAKQKGNSCRVELEVSNLSKRKGAEVVQVYVKGPKGGLEVAMVPVAVNANSHKKVQVDLDQSMFTTVIPKRGRVVIHGEYQIMVGSAQDSIQLLGNIKMK